MKKPKLIIVGDIHALEDADSKTADKVEFGMLIRCDNAEQIRAAMNAGKIEFSVFEDEELT